MKDFINPEWLSILKANNLDTFEKIWLLDADWFEPPNKRRGGWSGVSRLELQNPAGGQVVIFLKRQENHVYKPLRNFIKGAPTFRREMKNINRFIKHQLPIPDPVFYAERTVNKRSRAILITASIAPDYRSLEEWMQEWQWEGYPPRNEYNAIIKKVAETISKMHKHYLKHGALVAKHVFLNYVPGQEPSVRFIDLEKTRYWYLPNNSFEQDLKAFAKSFNSLITRIDMSRFYKHYMGVARLSANNIKLMRRVSNLLKRNER
ncbi:MAG: lipopolysaccharide kinase InaA family protein [Gammaproteobacteria bacterium]